MRCSEWYTTFRKGTKRHIILGDASGAVLHGLCGEHADATHAVIVQKTTTHVRYRNERVPLEMVPFDAADLCRTCRGVMTRVKAERKPGWWARKLEATP